MLCCKECSRPLHADEVALHKRLINRGANEFWCLTCMAKHFNVDEKLLRDKAEHFRLSGCTLFSSKPDLPPEKDRE